MEAWDPLRAFLDQHAARCCVLYTSEDVQATHYTLHDGTQLVLKVTSQDRADFEWQQMSNEVKAARSLPDCSCLGHQVAWREAGDGRVMSVSLYAGHTVETLLQEPMASGGWADMQLCQRVEVVRDVLAGGIHALTKMRPWLHFDVKPANVAVMPCPAGGPPHITLLDMGATTHIAALHAPQRNTLYPVVSTDHMDVALMTMQPGQVQLPYETKQGCREALSDTTDIFTLGLLAYKILLGPHLPPHMDWNCSRYQPWGVLEEQTYIAAQQRLARDLAAGSSSHPSTQALLQQLPQTCRHVLGRMCDPDPAGRAGLQQLSQMPFVHDGLMQLGVWSGARDAAYAAARQHLIDMLQDIPGIHLAARPGRVSRQSSSSNCAELGRVSSSSSLHLQHQQHQQQQHQLQQHQQQHQMHQQQQHLEVGDPPPGSFNRMPRGANAAREAAAAALQWKQFPQHYPHSHPQQQQQQRL